jgi:hypothetical protein
MGYNFGSSLSLEQGRMRSWAAPDHQGVWRGQFATDFFSNTAQVGQRCTGHACSDDSTCASDRCLTKQRDGAVSGRRVQPGPCQVLRGRHGRACHLLR